MSLYFTQNGILTTTQNGILTGTTATTLISALDGGAQITGINICNDTASAANITIDMTDGTTVHKLISAKSIAAHDVYNPPYEFILPNGWSLRATAGTGNALYVSVTYAKSIRPGS